MHYFRPFLLCDEIKKKTDFHKFTGELKQNDQKIISKSTH